MVLPDSRLPLPDALDEFLAPEIEAVFAFGGELALDHHLRGDAGVIGARLPQRGRSRACDASA